MPQPLQTCSTRCDARALQRTGSLMEENGDGYWTFSEWLDATMRKIVKVADSVSREDRVAWLDVQIRLAIMQALRHGRSGRADDDPVAR